MEPGGLRVREERVAAVRAGSDGGSEHRAQPAGHNAPPARASVAAGAEPDASLSSTTAGPSTRHGRRRNAFRHCRRQRRGFVT